MTRTGEPLFTGIRTYRHPTGLFGFRHPSDWERDDLTEDREGVIVAPVPEDPATYFGIWATPLDITVEADDLPELREGFDTGLAKLADVEVELAQEDAVGNIVRVERVLTFSEAGGVRKRKLWALYLDKWQVLVIYQGSSLEQYDYWLPMGNYCFNTFELPESLWFATDPELRPNPRRS